MALVQAINAETTPLNGQARFSSSSGQFNIVFELSGGANQMIDLNSIRMLANVDFVKSNGQHFNNFNVYGNSLKIPGVVALVPAVGTLPAYTTATNPYYDTDCRTGISNCINSVQFQDAESNVLEAVYSYPHLMNKVGPMSLSKDDQLTWTSHIYGVKSGGRQLQNQYALNSSLSCAIKLYTGLTQSKPIPFTAVRGKLKIIVTLNAPASALFGGTNTGANIENNTTGNPSQGSYFNLDNVRLVYRTLILDENAPILKQGYAYKHFSSLQSTINNSNNQNIYNPNTTNTLSVLTSFIKSEDLNTYNANSVKSDKLKNGDAKVEIFQTNFLKNNIRFPNEFPIDSREYNENNNGKVSYDAQRSYYFMSTLTPLSQLNNTLIQSSTESGGTLQCGAYDEYKEPDDTPVYGCGIRYANVSGSDGTNFTQGQSFLQRFQSGLNGNTPNEQFTSVLSTRRIVATASGPLVLN